MSLSKSLMPYYECALAWSREHPRLAATALASSLALLYGVKSRLTAPRLPPGPPAWPVVGSLFSLSEQMHLDFVGMREKYGDVFTVWIGTQPMVVLCSYAAIKEAFLTRGNDFADRPSKISMFDREVIQDEILLAPFNEKWARDKKYALTCLRTLGGIKAGADGSIVEEIAVLISKLHDVNQEPLDIAELTLNVTSNIISGVLFNERMAHDDPKLRDFRDRVSGFSNAMNDFPIIEFFLPSFLVNIFSNNAKNFKAARDRLNEYIAERVVEHQQSFDPASPRDFVDMYLNKPDIDVGQAFYDTMATFTVDGVHTMSLFMRWIVLYLGHHPEIQKKVQAEVDDVVGPSQMVTVAERPRLKYTEAVLLEVMRICDCSVGTPPHEPIADGMTFRGYDIPKFCQVTADFYGVHKDPKLFPEPEKFDPQRFLDAEGKIVNSNLVIPLGVGRRMCLGESLVRLELLLFLANVLHMFTIRFPADQPDPSVEPAGGVLQFPHPYKAVFVPRG